PHLTVLRNITLPLEKVKKMSKEEAEKKAWEVLKLVGLEDKAHSYPLQLSGGQQQRAAIARAMAMEPKLLLLDEPTSALDPELVEEVLEVLRTIAIKKQLTMIIVTHELDFAEDVADRVVFIDHGVIVEEGRASEILHAPKNPRTRQFLRRLLRRKGLVSTVMP
ncbi:MAG: amino acid ABC transporter ATP-binding protein, partial [Thermoprotei archaeon]|nr:amino acid ABC transporter ATP-binding protein [Thermoprotei archaeon]